MTEALAEFTHDRNDFLYFTPKPRALIT